MFIAAHVQFGAALLLCAVFAPAAQAQEASQSGRSWTDPPAKGAEVKPSGPAVAPPPAPRPAVQQNVAAGEQAKRHVVRKRHTPSQTDVAMRSGVRHRPMMVTATYPTRARSARPVALSAGYGYAPLPRRHRGIPVGEVERRASFDDWADDPRMARVRAAEAAGYIVVHGRSVQFPDGRSLQTYRPVGDDGDED